jgi:hypothetical protein
MRRRTPLLACLAFFAAAVLSAGVARADEPAAPKSKAKCVVMIIHALPDGQGVQAMDPKIDSLKPYLEKGPFTAWKRFSLLDEKSFDVSTNDTDRFTLPNGKQVAITYVDHVKREDGKHRLRLRLEIEDGPRKLLNTVFVLDEGGVVLSAGQKHLNGLLILGIRCEKRNCRSNASDKQSPPGPPAASPQP